jgi:hypothetical protein
MLTIEQFEAIGRLTISFNHLEYFMELHTVDLIGARDSIGYRIARREQFFDRKKRLLAEVLKALHATRPELQTRLDELLEVLDKAGDLAKQRNEIVHAVIATSNAENGYLWNTQKHTVPPCDVASIAKISEQIENLTQKLTVACGDLHRTLLSNK